MIRCCPTQGILTQGVLGSLDIGSTAAVTRKLAVLRQIKFANIPAKHVHLLRSTTRAVSLVDLQVPRVKSKKSFGFGPEF